MRKHLCKKETGRSGFTMMEMLTVVGVIAILLAIAIPSIISINKSLKFKQRNDYAESLFMAAQNNLTELRSSGSLAPLQSDLALQTSSWPLPEKPSDFGEGSWNEYAYTVSGTDAFDMLLPPGCIDETVRSQKVLIEYNPITGNVYSVFYSEDPALNMKHEYITAPGLPRADKDARKEIFLGYYRGTGLSSEPLAVRRPDTVISFENAQKGLVTVSVKIPTEYVGTKLVFMEDLQVELTVSGEMTKEIKEAAAGTALTEDQYSFTIPLKKPQSYVGLDGASCELSDDALAVEITYPLDSLADFGSFANFVYNKEGKSGKTTYLSQMDGENDFLIYPGDNITLTATADFLNAFSEPAVKIKPGILSGVNPLYEYLIPSAKTEGTTGAQKLVVGIANGRNLQNLNIMHPAIAKKIGTIMVTDDIDWADTLKSYTGVENNKLESPGRCLPYFVPLQNEYLFGKPMLTGDGSLPAEEATALPEIYGKDREEKNEKEQNKNESGLIKISSLNINVNKYSQDGFYANQTPDYHYTGLFSYLNTRVDNIAIVNPKVTGYNNASEGKDAGTGVLAGAVGRNAKITNCSTYLNTNASNFETVKSYTVRGWGAVGGLVGYAESNRTLPSGNLTPDLDHLTFYKCFAAVPVQGTMKSGQNAGFSEGVGGFVGVSRMANAYDCYASGNVHVDQTVITASGVSKEDLTELRKSAPKLTKSQAEAMNPLPYSGKSSVGAGGFVGTSHGTRYTSCFATGSAHAEEAFGNANFAVEAGSGMNPYKNQSCGVGSFVGVMCYDGNVTGKNLASQWTIFENCYAVGRPSVGDKLLNVFSGCNARDNMNVRDLQWKDAGWKDAPTMMYPGDYYRVLAPFKAKNGNVVMEPAYDLWYIFKNTYQYDFNEGSGETSNNCAAFISYDALCSLVNNHQSRNFKDSLMTRFGGYRCDDGTSYDEKYFRNAEIKKQYENAISHGFQKYWGAATSATTHPYNFAKRGQKYPFDKLNGLDYYGDWPEMPRSAGLAYYEVYTTDPAGVDYRDRFGIYFDREGAAKHNLKNKGDRYEVDPAVDSAAHPENVITLNPVVMEDGYIFLSENNIDGKTVSMGNVRDKKIQAVKEKGHYVKYKPGGSYGTHEFYVYKLPEEILKAFDPNEFYSKLMLSDGTAYYFNPNVALSQINPAGDVKEPEKPGSSETAAAAIPEDILIRSARHFKAVSTMENFWTNACSYLQQLDVDGTKYQWNGTYKDNKLYGIQIPAPIGVDGNVFDGTYRSLWASIRGFLPSGNTNHAGLFGHIGADGMVMNVSVEAIARQNEEIGGANAENAALVAGLNDGILNNVHVVLASNASASKIKLMAAFSARDDDDDEIYEDLFEDKYEDKLEDLTDDYEDHVEEINQLAETIKKEIDTLRKTLSKNNKKKFDQKFPDRARWGMDDEDNEYDEDEFKDIFEWFDEHLPNPGKPGANSDVDDTEKGPVVFTLSAKKKGSGEPSVGLIAGTSTGTIIDCTVNSTAKAGLTLDAVHAGGMIGTVLKAPNASTTAALFSHVNLEGGLFIKGSTGRNGGGFVGFSDNSSFTGDTVSIGSYDNAQTFTTETVYSGGFAGMLQNSSTDGCNVDLAANTTGHHFGGFAGKADGLKCSEASVVFHKSVSAEQTAGLIHNGTATQVDNALVKICDNFSGTQAAGGMFVSLDESSSVNVAKMDMMETVGSLQSQNQAAGFICTSKADISNARVLLPQYDETVPKWEPKVLIKITGNAASAREAAGFVCTMNGGKITGSSVSGSAVIASDHKAAGFAVDVNGESRIVKCFVTPVVNEVVGSKMPEYPGNSLENLKISGKTESAGFAVNVATSTADRTEAGVYNSHALARIEGKHKAGFAANNQGIIEGCMANIAMNSGHAFAYNADGGKVRHSYGWYRDGDTVHNGKIEVPAAPQTSYTSCYFADLDFIPEKDKEKPEDYDKRAQNVFLIDKDGNVEVGAKPNVIVASATVLGKLNVEGEPAHWFKADAFAKNPFDEKLTGESYAYPMLRDHFGDWREPPFPSFGVVYYEVYNPDVPKPEDDPATWKPDASKNTYWIHIRDNIKDLDNSLEGKTLNFYGYFDANGVLIPGTEGYDKPVLKGKKNEAKVYAKNMETGKDKLLSDFGSPSLDAIDGSVDIYKADYSVFCKELRKESDIPFDESAGPVIKRNSKYPAPGEKPFVLTEALKGLDLNASKLTAGTYHFYDLDDAFKKKGDVVIKSKDTDRSDPIKFNTWFADTLTDRPKNPDGTKTYEIRSAEQFQNIANDADPDETVRTHFDQTWDILNKYGNNKEFNSIPSFDGVYNANDRSIIVENGSNSWMGKIPPFTGSSSHQDKNRQVVTGGLNLQIVNTVTKPVFGSGIAQKVYLNEIRIGNINCPGNENGITSGTSAEFNCNKLIIEGDLYGSLFTDISGDSFTLGELFIGGKCYQTKDFEQQYRGTLCTNVTNCKFQCGTMTITSLRNTLFGYNMTGSVDITNLTFGETLDEGRLANIAGCPIHIGTLTLKKLPMHKTDGKPMEDAAHNPVMTSGVLTNGLVKTPNHNVTVDHVVGHEGSVFFSALFSAAQNMDFSNMTMDIAEAHLTASENGYAGILANEMYGCIVNESNFKIGKLTTSGDGTFGVVAGLADEKTDIHNSTVEAQIVNTVSDTENGGVTVIGAVVGENRGSAVSSCTVDNLDMVLQGDIGTHISAGGLIGVNKGELSNNKVQNAAITYIQPEEQSDSVDLGGLVGRSEGGSIKNTNTVSGKINLGQMEKEPEATDPAGLNCIDSGMLLSAVDVVETTGEAEKSIPSGAGRDYHIGGVVGTETSGSASEYENIVSSFEIDPNFADPKAQPTANDPAGQGSVGMFAGTVVNGTFKNCSANAENNTLFQFMGEIEAEAKKTDQDTLTGSGEKQNETVRGKLEDIYNGYQKSGTKTYHEFAAKFENCTFLKNGKSYSQTIRDLAYYYDQTGTEVVVEYEAYEAPVKAQKLESIALEALADTDTEGEFLATPYFGLVNGEYMPLFAKMTAVTKTIEKAEPAAAAETKSSEETQAAEETTEETQHPVTTVTTYRYELAYRNGDGFTSYADAEVKSIEGTWKFTENAVYTLTGMLQNGPYMILNSSNKMLALSEKDGTIQWQDQPKTMKDLQKRMIFNVSGSSGVSASLRNGADRSSWLNAELAGSKEKTVVNVRYFADGTIRLGSSEEAIKLMQLAEIETPNPDFTNTFSRCGTAQSIEAVPVGSENKTAKPAETQKPAEETKATEPTVQETEAVEPEATEIASAPTEIAQNAEPSEEAPVVSDGTSSEAAA